MVACRSPKPLVRVRIFPPLPKRKVMNMRTTLTEKGFWCPNCGEFIGKDELDCDDIYDLQQHGDVLYDCPYCGKSFWLEQC